MVARSNNTIITTNAVGMRQSAMIRAQPVAVRLSEGDYTSLFGPDRWKTYRRLSEVAELAWSPDGRTLVAFGFHVVQNVLHSPAFGASHPYRQDRLLLGRGIPDTDGEYHRRLRSSVAREFSAGAVAPYDETFRSLFHQTVGSFVDAGGGDFMQRVAVRVPAAALGAMLGIPPGEEAWVYQRVMPVIRFLVDHERDFQVASEARQGVERYVDEIISRDRRGILTRLAEAVDRGELGLVESRRIAIFLIAAGIETVVSALGNLMLCLATSPRAVWPALADSREARAFIEETLRLLPPLHLFFRCAVESVRLGATDVPMGTPVLVLIAAANRDPRAFREPDSLDLRRQARAEPHALSFGAGPHTCLGFNLANRELSGMLEAIRPHLPRLELAQDAFPYHGREFQRLNTLMFNVR